MSITKAQHKEQIASEWLQRVVIANTDTQTTIPWGCHREAPSWNHDNWCLAPPALVFVRRTEAGRRKATEKKQKNCQPCRDNHNNFNFEIVN